MREASRPRKGWNGGQSSAQLGSLTVPLPGSGLQSEAETTNSENQSRDQPSSPKRATEKSEPRDIIKIELKQELKEARESTSPPSSLGSRPVSSSQRTSSFASAQPSAVQAHSTVGFARARGQSAAPLRVEKKEPLENKEKEKETEAASVSPPSRPLAALPESAPSSTSNSVSGSARSTIDVSNNNSNRSTVDLTNNSARSTVELSSLSEDDRKVRVLYCSISRCRKPRKIATRSRLSCLTSTCAPWISGSHVVSACVWAAQIWSART